MISFVNIETGQFFEFESWNQIIAKGGLRNIFTEKEYPNIYNESCARQVGALNGNEPPNMNENQKRSRVEILKAYELFNVRKDK
jgi:hypothetical protein